MTRREALKAARAKLAAVGLRITWKGWPWNEYRVWNPSIPRDRQEATEAFASDLDEAVNTGLAMAREGAW